MIYILNLWNKVKELNPDKGDNLDYLRNALKNRDLNRVNYFRETPIYVAISKGELAACKILIELEANVNVANNYGNTPLHQAALKGEADICKALIAAGANVNAVNSDGNTPLHLAASKEQINVCKVLIAAGANVNAANNGKSTPLHYTASTGNVDLCIVLIEANANLSAVNENGQKPLKNELLKNGKNKIDHAISKVTLKKGLTNNLKNKQFLALTTVLLTHFDTTIATQGKYKKKPKKKRLTHNTRKQRRTSV